jgi:hypothetical protein
MSKLAPTGNPFLDQYNFMNACDQSTGALNKEQDQLYYPFILMALIFQSWLSAEIKGKAGLPALRLSVEVAFNLHFYSGIMGI